MCTPGDQQRPAAPAPESCSLPHRLGCHQHVHLLHPAQLRHGSSCKAGEPASCCHSAPLEGVKVVARHPRSRRNSLELANSSSSSTGGSGFFTQAGPTSIKERLRQRRFSIAIGESLHQLKPIREGETEDAAGWSDQFPLSTTGSHSSSSQHSLGLRVWSAPPAGQHDAFPPGVLCAVRTPSDPGVAAGGGLDPGGMFALLQHSAAHAATQQQGDGQTHPPQVLQVHHSNSHTLTGLRQEEIWHHLQQRRLEQQRQREQQQRQTRRARHAPPPPVQQQQQLQQPQHHYLAQQRQQHVDDDNFEFWVQQPQQQQQHDDGLEALQQQLQELSYTRPGSLPTPVMTSSTSRSRVHMHQHQVHRPPLSPEHVEALAALHEIEGELQQLLSMQDRLAAARTIAPPGSRAAAACEAALMRHQAVLQQALAARQEIASAVFEATAAMQMVAARASVSAPLPWQAAAELMGLHDADAQYESLGCLEGFDEEPLYPADAESLLQHFGHYAII